MRIEIPGPVGKLIGELEEPEGDRRGLALVCHPHPRHGGTMRNTIVTRVARALRAAGLVTLRFNFRGVEGSEGVHDGSQEIEDAIAAAAVLMREHPGLPLWAAGYSFGARIVAELAFRDVGVERLVLVAFPLAVADPGVLARLRQPALLVLGGADSFGSPADLRRAIPHVPAQVELVELADADHFFRGRTPLVEEAVLRYARAAIER